MMPTPKKLSLVYLVVLVFLGLAALPTRTVLAAVEPSETVVLQNLATKVISPRLKAMAETAGQLSQAADELCRVKDQAALDKARSAWTNGFLAWRAADPLLIGPAAKLYLRKRIGAWMATDTLFKAAIDSPEFANLRGHREYRGYAAAEYILFSESHLASTTTPGRCSHLLEVTKEIAELTASANTLWQEQYMQGFIAAGDGKPFLLATDAISPVFAGVLNTLEMLLRDTIGLPSNFFKDKAKPELLEAWHSNSTGAAMQAAITGITQTLTSDDQQSLLSLLAEKPTTAGKNHKKLAESIDRRLHDINREVHTITSKHPNLHSKLGQDKALLKPLYKELQKLQDDLVKASLALELDVRTGLEAQLSK